jgi:hypothetical protein
MRAIYVVILSPSGPAFFMRLNLAGRFAFCL